MTTLADLFNAPLDGQGEDAFDRIALRDLMATVARKGKTLIEGIAVDGDQPPAAPAALPPIPTQEIAPRPDVGTLYRPMAEMEPTAERGMPEPMPAGAPHVSGISPAPAPAERPAFQEPGMLSTINTWLSGLGRGGGAILPALGEAGRAVEGENMTVRALMQRGLPQDQATLIARNPAVLQQVLSGMVAPKVQKLGPNEALVASDPNDPRSVRELYRNQDKLVPFAEGGGLYDPNAGQVVAGGTPKDTALEKDYTNYVREERQAGRQPLSRIDYQERLKRAGATVFTIDQKGEVEFSKEVGKQQAKRFNDLVERGMQAKIITSDLHALREIGARIPGGTGKTAEITAALGPYAELVGIKIDGLDDIQAFNAIAARLAPRMRAPGSGATSDFEMRKFLEGLPAIGRQPGGNEVVANVFEALERFHEAAADIGSRAMAREITPAQAERELRSLPDPLTAWREWQKVSPAARPGGAAAPPSRTGAPQGTKDNPAQPATIEDALRLPRGTVFIVPDGPLKGTQKVR